MLEGKKVNLCAIEKKETPTSTAWIWAIPPHIPPHPPPYTMGTWPRQLRPLLYIVFIFFILLLIAIAFGRFEWVIVIFVAIFIVILIGLVYSRTHPEEDDTETSFE